MTQAAQDLTFERVKDKISDTRRTLDGIMKNRWAGKVPEDQFNCAMGHWHLAVGNNLLGDFQEAVIQTQLAELSANKAPVDYLTTAVIESSDILNGKAEKFLSEISDLSTEIEKSGNLRTMGDIIEKVFNRVMDEVKKAREIEKILAEKRGEHHRRLVILNKKVASWPEGSTAETLSQMYRMVFTRFEASPKDIKGNEEQIVALEKTIEMFEKLRESQAEELKALETKSAEIGGN